VNNEVNISCTARCTVTSSCERVGGAGRWSLWHDTLVASPNCSPLSYISFGGSVLRSATYSVGYDLESRRGGTRLRGK